MQNANIGLVDITRLLWVFDSILVCVPPAESLETCKAPAQRRWTDDLSSTELPKPVAIPVDLFLASGRLWRLHPGFYPELHL